jgi:Tfp pilus assembly protein PilO
MTPAKSKDNRVLAAFILAGLVFVWAYVAYVIQPLMASASDLDQKIRSGDTELRHIQQALAQEPKLQREQEELTEAMRSLRTVMPAEQELASIIEQVSAMATHAGVKIQTIFPQRSLESFKVVAGLDEKRPQQSKLFKEIPIQINALAGYHQLGAFLNRVEQGKQPMYLKSLRITTNPKELRRHTVEVVIIAYFASTDPKSTASATLTGER